MTAYNVVRFRTKPGQDKAFEKQFREIDRTMNGMRRFVLIKTGDGAYCSVGEWDSFEDIVNARPAMLNHLDTLRDMLEDLGGGFGLTDPVSGPAVFEAAASHHRKVA